MSQPLQEQIAEWLEGAVERQQKAAHSSGTPDVISVERPKLFLWSDTDMTAGLAAVSVNPLVAPTVRFQVQARLESDGPTNDLAQELSERCAAQRWAWAPLWDPNMDAATVLARAVLRPAVLEYMSSLPRPGAREHERLGTFADAITALLETGEGYVVASVPLGGLRLDGATLQTGAVTLRPLTTDELEDFLSRAGTSSFNVVALTKLGQAPRVEVRTERAVLEVREKLRPDGFPFPSLLHPVVLALQLRGYELHGEGSVATSNEPVSISSYGSTTSRVTIPEHGGWATITQDELDLAVELAQRIPLDALGDPRHSHHIALQRFQLGAARNAAAEALLDYVTSLEAILLRGVQAQEITFRFRLFGARYLGSTPEERVAWFKALGKLYGTRSSLIHGKEVPSTDDLAHWSLVGRAAAGQAISKALRRGWPAREDFEQDSLH